MTTNKPEVVAWGVPNSRLTERQPFMQLLHTQEGTQYPELLDSLIRLSDYEALQAECTLLREQLDAMAEHKMAARQLIGIPASVGICEPIEGFAARPQDIMPAVRDMALKIEALQAENERLRKDAERYRSLRIGDIDDIAVVRGLGAMDYGMSAVIGTYSEEIDGDVLDAAIDAAMSKEGK